MSSPANSRQLRRHRREDESREMHIEFDVAALDPAKFTKSLFKGRPELWQWSIIFVVEEQQNTNPTYSLGLLRTRGKGPFRGRANAFSSGRQRCR